MAAIRKISSIFGGSSTESENVDPKSLVGKRLASNEISHQSKLFKPAPGKETAIAATRRVLGDRSTNIPTFAAIKDAKKTVAAPAPVLAPVAETVVPQPVIKPITAPVAHFPVSERMDTNADMIELGEDDIEDVDKFDSDNPQLVSEYVKDIYSYLLELETRFAVSPRYMDGSTTVTPVMRTILVDWLVEVHMRFKLVQETVFLTVHIMDRVLEKMPVPRNKLQLLGLGCFLIASKYEDTYPPRINDLIIVSNKAFTRQEILAMETTILEKLNYDLGTPVPLHFLRRYSKVADSDAETHTVAKYLLELAALDYEMCQYKYSQQGAAALYIARNIFGHQSWNRKLEFYSGYSEAAIAPCVAALSNILVNSPRSKYQAVRTKYASSKLMKISVHENVEAYIQRHSQAAL